MTMLFTCARDVYTYHLILQEPICTNLSENEKNMVQEILDFGIIQPRKKYFFGLVMIIHTNECPWNMFSYYKKSHQHDH